MRTLLNSGNVVYSAPGVTPADAAARIEAALPERLGVSAWVVALDRRRPRRGRAENPLAAVADNPSRLLVAVPSDPAAVASLAPLAGRDWAPRRWSWVRASPTCGVPTASSPARWPRPSAARSATP